ncbi:MAG: SlyX family protein [Acidobacteriota bacterium]
MTPDERLGELEIRVAFQDKLIADLDALVRALGVRLDAALREVEQLKNAIRSPELPLGGAGEKPPHY